MKRILSFISSLMITSGLLVAVSASAAVYAGTTPVNPESSKALCEGSGGTWDGQKCSKTGAPTLPEAFANITNLLLFIIGAIAVVVIIIGGIRYVTSSGDATATKSAKDTILYALIGLVVAFLAYAIVNFVTGQF
jgi:hypothetical protein